MTPIFQILCEMYKPTEEELRLARERILKHVLRAMLALKNEGNEFPSPEAIRMRLIATDNGMNRTMLQDYCELAKSRGYIQKLWPESEDYRFVLSEDGYIHLGLPA